MDEAAITNVLLIVVSRLKQSEDSFEVFKSVLNLSIASKSCKKYLNDKILIETSYRYVRDRTRFVVNKLKFFIRNNDFEGFETLTDLFVERYTRLESVRKLNSLLIYITQHTTCDFLRSYLTYFFDRGLHCGSIQNFRTEWFQVQPIFPDFRPNILMGALKLASKNGWHDKLQLLLCRMLTFCNVDPNQHMDLITATIQQNTSFKYDIGGYLMDLYRYKIQGFYSCESILRSMTQKQERIFKDQSTRIEVTKELLQQPIDKQPWFFGNLMRREIEHMFRQWCISTRDAFLVGFYGSRLFYHQSSWKKQLFNEKTIGKLPKYGFLNTTGIKDLGLYEFYLRLAAHDLEGMKQLQNTHGFDWRTILSKNDSYPSTSICTNSQPHPLIEYLNFVDDIRQDIVEWLFDLCPIKKVRFEWEGDEISEQKLPIIRKIIKLGGTISTNLWVQYIAKAMPANAKDLKVLMDAWDDIERTQIWNFVLDQYKNLCKQRKIITDTKMTVLLAWTHASGESIGFKNLPRDLIRLIVDFIDEPPLISSLAHYVAYRFRGHHVNRCTRPASWFKNNLWAIEFFARSGLSYGILHATAKETTQLNYSIFRKTKKSILYLAQYSACHLKFIKFMFKYETDWRCLQNLWQSVSHNVSKSTPTWHNILSIEALKTQNETALKFLKDSNAFVMPTKEEFQQAIKPKHNLTYERALKLVRDIK